MKRLYIDCRGLSSSHLIVGVVVAGMAVVVTLVLTGYLKLQFGNTLQSGGLAPSASSTTAVSASATPIGAEVTGNSQGVGQDTKASNTPQASAAIKNGFAKGKLCYPSEVLPSGIIEAKRVSDNQVLALQYPGSKNGGGSSYNFELSPGEYVLRYKVSESLIGYSTTVCPTGNETTCGDTKQRVVRTVKILAGADSEAYDLCDFYYQASNAPSF